MFRIPGLVALCIVREGGRGRVDGSPENVQDPGRITEEGTSYRRYYRGSTITEDTTEDNTEDLLENPTFFV